MVLFALPLNLLFIINFVDLIQRGIEKDKKYLLFKFMLLFLSFGGIILFTLLGRIEHCKCKRMWDVGIIHSGSDYHGRVFIANLRKSMFRLCRSL